MAVLRIESGVDSGISYFIEERATLGRDPKQATIHIRDHKASRVHAKIIRQKGEYFLKDCNSKNGTLLNGKPVKKTVKLEPGDYIGIGYTWAYFGEKLEIETINRQLSTYKILQEIKDTSSAGHSYKANQVDLVRTVTLNLLPPNIIRNNPQLKNCFHQQAMALAKLNHENISIILDFEEKEAYLYFTTEYLEGESLATFIRDKKEISIEKTLEIGIAIARALAHAHEKKVIHQDVSPLNVVICGRRIILRGFGVSAVLSEVKDNFQGLIGRIEYLSPEQISKQQITYKTDIYSLGVLLYELLTTVTPFVGDNPDITTEIILNDPPKSITSYNSFVTAEIENIIYQCLEKDPKDRPENCEEIADKLEEILLRRKVLKLKDIPNVTSFALLHYLNQILEKPLFVWIFFPFFSFILLIFIKFLITD